MGGERSLHTIRVHRPTRGLSLSVRVSVGVCGCACSASTNTKQTPAGHRRRAPPPYNPAARRTEAIKRGQVHSTPLSLSPKQNYCTLEPHCQLYERSEAKQTCLACLGEAPRVRLPEAHAQHFLTNVRTSADFFFLSTDFSSRLYSLSLSPYFFFFFLKG